MAGHSHWANIQHKKGAADAKRGRLFTKLSRAIMIAARHGGGDPETNLKLRYAIDKARQYSMPKDNIERAIKKGTGESDGSNFEEIIYEGYGPGGVAIMCEVLTDNRNRTAGEVRKIFDRAGGNLGTSGCVAYMFERKGFFSVDATTVDEEHLMEIVVEAGADDLKRSGDSFEVTCDPTAFNDVQVALEKHEITPQTAEITYLASTPLDPELEDGQKIMKLMSTLDDHDDIQNVYSNINISDELIAALEE